FVSAISCSSPLLFYSLSLHDALPISFFLRKCPFCFGEHWHLMPLAKVCTPNCRASFFLFACVPLFPPRGRRLISFYSIQLWSPADRKSTRLNSSHVKISYAVFCLKNK